MAKLRTGWILITGAALAAGACNRGEPAEPTVNGDGGLTAQSITANDITAIDAVTGAAANMAADMRYDEIPGSSGGEVNTAARATGKPRPVAEAQSAGAPTRSAMPERPEPAPEPTPANSE